VGYNNAKGQEKETKRMSLQSTFPAEIPPQTREIGEAILGETDVCYFLGNHIEAILSEADFVAMYSATGRPGIHPLILAMVTVFQYLEKLPDRRASEQAVKRLDWKYALRQELTWLGFHYADLCNFRKRLLAHDASELVFEKIIQYLLGQGWLKARGKQRTDATHILAQVQRLSQLELKWEGLRMALVDLISRDAPWVLAHVSEHLITSYASSRNTYRMSEAELKRVEKQTHTDMAALLEVIDTQGDETLQALTYVRLLHRVAVEQSTCVDPQEFPDWPDSALELDLPEGLINSPHEPHARYSEKRGKDWAGYKTHLTETVDGEHGNFITDVHVTPANVHDTQALAAIQDHLASRDVLPDEQVVDQGYMSAELIDTSQERGIILQGRVQASASSKPVGFRLCDFDIDIEHQQARCPAGKTSVRWSSVTSTKNVAYRAFFGQQCRDCPFFRDDACTTSPSGRRLDINAHHDTLQRRRQEQQTDAFKKIMNQRTAIEGTISETVRRYGLRHNRYRGLAKTQLQASFTGAAMNLNRLMAAQRHFFRSYFSICFSIYNRLANLQRAFFNTIIFPVPTKRIVFRRCSERILWTTARLHLSL